MFLDWSAEDQGSALAWMIEQRNRCKTCGLFEWQWPEDGSGDLELDVFVCYSCEQVDREVDRRSKDQVPHPGLKLGFFPIGS